MAHTSSPPGSIRPRARAPAPSRPARCARHGRRCSGPARRPGRHRGSTPPASRHRRRKSLRSVNDERRRQTASAACVSYGKRQRGARRWGAAIWLHALLEVGVDGVGVLARDLGEAGIRKGRIQQPSVLAAAVVHRAPEVGRAPAADALRLVGREVAGDDRAEWRVDAQPACIGLAAARGVAARRSCWPARDSSRALDLPGGVAAKRSTAGSGGSGSSPRTAIQQLHHDRSAFPPRRATGRAPANHRHAAASLRLSSMPATAQRQRGGQRGGRPRVRRHRLQCDPASDRVDVLRRHLAADLGHAVRRERVPVLREPRAELRGNIEARQADQRRYGRLHAGEPGAVALHAGRDAARGIALQRQLPAALQGGIAGIGGLRDGRVGRQVEAGEVDSAISRR